MEINIDVEELDSVIEKLETIIDNTHFANSSINSIIGDYHGEKLFGIDKLIDSRMKELHNYNSQELYNKIKEFQENIQLLKENFETLDLETKNKLE